MLTISFDGVTYLMIAAAIAAVIAINVCNWRRRRWMTPAERQIEDDETERELQIW